MFLGVGVLVGLYHLRVRHLKRQRRQQQIFSEQLLEQQEVERRRIAKELHDGLGQELMVIQNHSVLAMREGDSSASLEVIQATATQAVGDVRAIAYDLHPVQLERLGPTRAIRRKGLPVPEPCHREGEVGAAGSARILSMASRASARRPGSSVLAKASR